MISKFSLTFAEYFAARDAYGYEKIKVYQYGFELLLSTVLNLLGLLVIAILLKVPVGAALFCAAFIPLRLAAGGYHANHHWSCILGFNVIFLGFAMLYQYLNPDYLLAYSLTAAIISSLLVWSLAPVEAANKPLKAEQRERQRTKSIIIICVNLAVTLLFFALPETHILLPSLFFYNSGAFAASLSLGMAVMQKRWNR